MFVRTIQNLEALEHEPLATRLSVRSTYELIREAARQDPERTTLTFFSERDGSDPVTHLSSCALLSSLHQRANLLADLGIGPGDVIAILLPQLLETSLFFWAGQATGIVCPISPRLDGEQIVALLLAVKAKVLVAAGPQLSQDVWHKVEMAHREVQSITTVLQVGGPGKERDGVYAFDLLRDEYASDGLHTGHEMALDDIAAYFPTETTTGTPDFIALTHGNLLYAAWALATVTRLAPQEVLLRGLWQFMQRY